MRLRFSGGPDCLSLAEVFFFSMLDDYLSSNESFLFHLTSNGVGPGVSSNLSLADR